MATEPMTEEEIAQLARECETCPLNVDGADPLAVAWRHIHRLVGEVQRRGAIIEGRTVPPTDEEIAAIQKEGGQWSVTFKAWDTAAALTAAAQARSFRDGTDRGEGKWVWRALDSRRRPRAWPVVPPRSTP